MNWWTTITQILQKTKTTELIVNIPFLQVKEIFSAGIGGSGCESDTPDYSPFEGFFDDNLDAKFDSQLEDIINIIRDWFKWKKYCF